MPPSLLPPVCAKETREKKKRKKKTSVGLRTLNRVLLNVLVFLPFGEMPKAEGPLVFMGARIYCLSAFVRAATLARPVIFAQNFTHARAKRTGNCKKGVPSETY